MHAVRLDFNPNSLSQLKNFVAVLAYLRGKGFEVETYQKGIIPELVNVYLEQFKEEQGLGEEKGVSRKVVQAINTAWIKKKYQDPSFIQVLHTWLIALDYSIHKEELQGKHLGETTQSALEKAQEHYQLPITGEMSLPLEQRLQTAYHTVTNSAIQTEILQVNDTNRLQKIVTNLSLNDEGERVQHLQLALAWLGETVYKGEYRAAQFGKQTRLAVIQYQKKHTLEASGKLTKETAEHINAQLLVSKPSLLDSKTYRVRGSVKDDHWKPIEAAQVQVYEQVMRSKPQLLGERTVAKNGFYDLVYTPPIHPKTQQPKDCFHLMVHIKGPKGELLKELTFFNVSATTWANYTAGPKPYQGKSLYEEHMALLTPHLEGLAVEEIEESDRNQDLRYLNACSGLGGRDILLLSLAHRLARRLEKYELHPSLFYALFQQQLPEILPSQLLPDYPKEWQQWIHNLTEQLFHHIALMPRGLQETAFEKAATTHLLPIEVEHQLKVALEKLHEWRLKQALEAPLVTKEVSLQQFLQPLSLSDDDRTVLVQQFSQAPVLSAQWIDQLAKEEKISSKTQQQLQQEYALFQLSEQSLETLQQLKAVFGQDGYSTPIQRVSDFAKWTLEDWKRYVEQPTPRTSSKSSNISQLSRRSDDALRAKERSVQPDPTALYNKAVAAAPSVATLATLQRSNADSFQHLGAIAEHVDQHQWISLVEVPLAQLTAATEKDLSKEGLEELKAIQRIQKVAPSPQVAAVLLGQGIHSAHQAYNLGASDMTTLLEQNGMSEAEAMGATAHILGQSQQQIGAVLGLGTALQLMAPATVLTTNVLPQLVNLDELFGSTDTCGCVHCRSVYSPAAYLTDLLKWLRDRDAHALTELFDRRPDLQHILLNCKNAHTPLPYIDLSNEVLEYAIEQDSAYLKRNTTWNADILRLQPEYQLDTVYEQLAHLPNHPQFKPTASYNGFNLWQAQAHLYLEKMGINFADLVAQLGQYPNATTGAIARVAAYFKMPTHEVYDLLTTDYDYSTHPAVNNQVEQFLKVHKLTYDQLIELLQCSFINVGGAIEIHPLDTCSLSDKQFVGLTNVHHNKIWRFLRLWKYTNWELWELNLALIHPLVGQGALTETSLERLVELHQLQQQLNSSLQACLTLFGTINTTVWYTAQNKPQGGLYQQVYLAEVLDQNIRTALIDPSAITLNLSALSPEQLNYLAQALGTSTTVVEETLTLPILGQLTQTGATTVAQTPPLEGLSQLYAYTLLREALKIEATELVAIGQLLRAGVNVFQSMNHFRTFLEVIMAWQAQGTTVATIQYLLDGQHQQTFLPPLTLVTWYQDLQALLDEAYEEIREGTDTDRLLLQGLLRKMGKFESEEKIQDFLDLVKDPSTSNSLTVSGAVALYFDYLSLNEQNFLVTTIQAQSNNPAAIEALFKLVHRYLNRTVVYEFFSTRMNMPLEVLTWVMEEQPTTPSERFFNRFFVKMLPPTHPLASAVNIGVTNAYHHLQRLDKAVQLLGLDLATVQVLEQYAGILQLVKPTTIPNGSATIEQWNQTQYWLQWSVQHDSTLMDIVKALVELQATNNTTTYFNTLEEIWDWDADALMAFQSQFGWSVADYLQPQKYHQLVQWQAWLQQSGETPTVLLSWTNLLKTTPYNLPEQKVLAMQIQQSVQQAVAPNQWLLYKQQVQDQLRTLKRDALLAYAQNTAPAGYAALLSVNELYSYHLIDPAMSACQYSSRIKQAISSVQLYIQRCLMGLEANINTQDPTWKQWTWMQNYRVWEANRKVFLYPENWIDPRLRDNKSELFVQLEDQLLQAEITQENVEKALRDYLVKLHHIANLEMKSICRGTDGNTVHVLARTKESPVDYYYRKLDKASNTWTAWQKIEVTIKGEHPVLYVYNGRVHLFWLEILERPQRQVMQHDTPPTMGYRKGTGTATRKNTVPEPPKYKEIQLAWMVLYDTGWSPQTLSKRKLIHPWPRPDYSLHLRPRLHTDDLWLDVYVSTSLEFNQRAFYNQFNNKYEKLTTETFNENQRPWHSSSFVFDGFVRTVKIKPIQGTYWYVGWNTQSVIQGTQTQTVPLMNSGPIWIEKIERIPGAAGPFSASHHFLWGQSFIGWKVFTNYGDFDLGNSTQRNRFNNLVNITMNRGAQSDPPQQFQVIAITVTGAFKVYAIWTRHPPGFVLQDLTKDYLNRYLHQGNLTSMATRPMTTQVITIYGRKLVPAINPDYILRLKPSTSHEYIYHSFDKEGRQIEVLHNNEQQHNLYKPDGLHFEYNHIVPNKEVSTSNLVSSFFYDFSFVPRNATEKDFQMTVSSDSQFSRFENYKHVLYQDQQRSFHIHSENVGAFTPYGDTKLYGMYHPFVRDYISELGSKGLDGLYERTVQLRQGNALVDFYAYFNYVGGDITGREQTHFNAPNGYSIYNWELFFHIPLLIATELSKNQRFEEAMHWFHYIFDPKGVQHGGTVSSSDTSKYWITKPFFEQAQAGYQNTMIQDLLGGTLSPELRSAIELWRNNPFQPHLIARMRPVAYQKAVLMHYLDNLIDWGDQLFRRDTLESINQAALRYIMAAEILGDSPYTLASQTADDRDYADLQATLNDFSNTNVSVQLENVAMWTNSSIYGGTYNYTVPQIDVAYFCIPKNEKLAGYWDLVADRLFKIRHCMNIDGVVRQLPLFAPPIDPALLVNAQANGLDLGAVLDDLSTPKINYRYRALARLAVQFCNEVKGLGQSLLSALQSKDAEGMALLQSGNALQLLDATIALKELQIQEAEESIIGMELSKQAAELRKDFYEGRDFMNRQEGIAEQKNRASITLDTVGLVTEGIAAILNIIPKVEILVPTLKTEVVDGMRLSNVLRTISSMVFRTSGIVSKEAGMAATQGSYNRRQEEWDFQAQIATKDIEQIDQQIATAKIRVELAKKDLKVHRLQIENARSEQEYLQSKYTNQQLYSWMVGQLSKVYFQAYQLAFDMAKRAEKSLRYELALPTTAPAMIQFGYWDSMKKGLLAGDKLMLAINRMEAYYVEKHNRELELTKHISLQQWSPEALLQLRTTGKCQVRIPQWWFDVDYPGHYLRRIKALSLSIPCVVGPHTNVSCTLTMTKNSIQDKDGNYTDHYETQSIATSSAQNDAGVFELNFNGERFLPFEGAGAVSEWTLRLPELASFDYQTITDVVFHMRYMAKDGGATMAATAKTALDNALNQVNTTTPPVVLLSLKQAFPTAWHRFIHGTNAGQLNMDLLSKHYPYFSSLFGSRTIEDAEVGVLLAGPINTTIQLPIEVNVDSNTISTGQSVTIDPSLNNRYGILDLGVGTPLPALSSWTLDLSTVPNLSTIEDVFLVLKYKLS